MGLGEPYREDRGLQVLSHSGRSIAWAKRRREVESKCVRGAVARSTMLSSRLMFASLDICQDGDSRLGIAAFSFVNPL